jgi:predicted ArsR family transcriptional regulator
MKEILLRKSDELNGACRNYLENLKKWLKENGKLDFGNREVSLSLRIPNATVKRHHYQLTELGFLEVKKQKESRSYRYQLSQYAKEDHRDQAIEKALNDALYRAESSFKPKAERLSGSVTAKTQNEPSKALKIREKTPSAQ